MKIDLHEIIRQAEDDYVHGKVQLGDFVSWSMHGTIERIIAYLNSKHITGDKDSLGREKPFFNIIIAAVNIWYRATDIDRKDITIRPTKGRSVMLAFLATVLLQDWMRKTKHGVFLNQWGRALAQYGSAVVKFVEKQGVLIPSVVSWNRIICDPIDFDALPRIEKIYKTPAQLRRMKEYDKDQVDNLVTALTARKTQQGMQVDNRSKFVELYEVHGELPKALLMDEPEDEDWGNYVQQIHIISYVKNNQDKYDNFTLYKGREKQDPYMLTHLIEEDGRTLSIGAVETLFDAQWMQNHSMKNMKDTLDIASKLIFQTADGTFIGRNALSAIETGQILIHAENKPITQMNTYKPDITSLQNFANQWRVLSQELTATPDAMRGITPPSGTPYSTTALLTGQSTSLFEIMVENKGLALEEMLRRFIIPHLKSKMDTTDEVSAILEDHQIKQVDAIYIPNKAVKLYNQRTKDRILAGMPAEPFDKGAMETEVQNGMITWGNKRFFIPDKTWKEILKDMEWEFETGITNEPADKQAILTSLISTLQTIAGFAGRTMTSDEKLVFNKIMNFTGAVSPIELSTARVVPPQGGAPIAGQLPELTPVK